MRSQRAKDDLWLEKADEAMQNEAWRWNEAEDDKEMKLMMVEDEMTPNDARRNLRNEAKNEQRRVQSPMIEGAIDEIKRVLYDFDEDKVNDKRVPNISIQISELFNVQIW